MTHQDILKTLLNRSAGCQRYIVAIAGPPGSGKSTLAVALAQQLPQAQVLQMDGFHYDNAVLDQFGWRARKGAPETFDYAGFAAILNRIRNLEPTIAIPLFDRTNDLARAGAAIIATDTKIILVEGNYLLLNESPWSDLAPFFDATIFLDVPVSELYRRLMQRWLSLGKTREQAEHWVASNDMPNVHRVLSRRRAADFNIAAAPDHPSSATESEASVQSPSTDQPNQF